MRILKAIALTYDSAQDRILAVANAGALDSWSFWLTRRLVVGMLGRVPPALASTSPRAKQVPAEYRSEVGAFEHQAAMATTQPAMSQTTPSILQANAAVAELATSVSISDQGANIHMEVRGDRGGAVGGTLGRPELQRVLQMLRDEAAKADWLGPLISAGAPEAAPAAATRVKH